MKVELGKYRLNHKFVRQQIESRGTHQLSDMLNEIAVSIHCPVIVIYYYAGEIIGFTPEINRNIELLKKFYQITEVRE